MGRVRCSKCISCKEHEVILQVGLGAYLPQSVTCPCPFNILATPGSEYKIDASYLSPNVNLASRLEAATKQYSVPMLLSRDFVDCLSPGVRVKVSRGCLWFWLYTG
jgi:hypothetical protein